MVFSLEKCSFAYSDIKVLGYGLSRYGLHILSEKVTSITSLAPPNTLRQLHRLMGMFGYYRSFIHQFAKIAKPLNDLKKSKSPSVRRPAYNSRQTLEWTPECQEAFEELKLRMCNAPILVHPIFDRPFILYTDASADAFAAVLCQVWERDDYIQGEAPTLMSNSNTEWEQ